MKTRWLCKCSDVVAKFDKHIRSIGAMKIARDSPYVIDMRYSECKNCSRTFDFEFLIRAADDLTKQQVRTAESHY